MANRTFSDGEDDPDVRHAWENTGDPDKVEELNAKIWTLDDFLAAFDSEPTPAANLGWASSYLYFALAYAEVEGLPHARLRKNYEFLMATKKLLPPDER